MEWEKESEGKAMHHRSSYDYRYEDREGMHRGEDDPFYSENTIREMKAWKEKAAEELKTLHENIRQQETLFDKRAAVASHNSSDYHDLIYGWKKAERGSHELRSRLREHIASHAYKERASQILKANTTGILIPAGGAKLTTNLLITLRVLRHHLKSTLPIEVMWQSKDEMDNFTWSNISEDFEPIRGIDISSTPHPVPNLHLNVTLKKYMGKVFSLLLSDFRYVILLDADCMPTQDPQVLFDTPQFLTNGNLFWPDAWEGTVRDDAFDSVGLQYKGARDVINQGKGFLPRDTESGQLVLDRARHLDVLEYLFWINGERERGSGDSLWGDKDTFSLAFACAGKAHLYSQVAVPPSGLFSWQKDMLLEKETDKRYNGWQLLGFMQHDPLARAAFIHRTINKFSLDNPWEIDLVSSPMPTRWVNFYLAHENHGPTRGVPWNFVVPSKAFSILSEINQEPGPSAVCPVFSFTSKWTMLESGLPTHITNQMREVCQPLLKILLGSSYSDYQKYGWLQHPQLKFLDRQFMTEEPNWRITNTLYSTPIPAFSPDVANGDPADPFISGIKASYEAYKWLKAHAYRYPIITRKQPPPAANDDIDEEIMRNRLDEIYEP